MTAVFAAAILFVATAARGQATGTITIQANQPGAVVSSNLFGIFFEEINFGGEGGIYGELVRNRSFASSSNPDYWTLVTTGTAAGTMSVDTSLPLNTNNLNSLNLTMSSGTGTVGAMNAGFWGIVLKSGATYDLGLYARGAAGFAGPIQVKLQNSSGSTTYAQTSITGLTTNWQRFTAALVSTGTDTNAQLVVSISNVGTVYVDEVSLFPRATFNNRTNGLRPDIANLLVGLKPSFLRFPGGNFIESNTITNAVRWKKSIGDTATRPGHLNDSWGYWCTDGYGLDEGFRECEDMGMQMLYGINAGLMLGYNGGANNTVPLNQMGPWVQDAVDLIQYANGDTNTTWGALRAANGHPAPYNLNYMEIGNENGGSYLNDRYTLFYDAIKSNYPSIHLIAAGGNWSGGPPWSRPVEIMDEHYYSDPATFIGYATKYDSYNRSGPKVFVGEYAVTSGYGTYGNLSAALGEASFMTGMERNSDLVALASYAPLFANVNGTQWHPDLIYYNNSQVFGTPSYYVQKMYSLNRGDVVLPATVTFTNNAGTYIPHGTIGVGSWNTLVQYTNILVTSNTTTLYQSDFVNQGTNGWSVFNGTWGVTNGLYQQTAPITDCYSTYMTNGSTNWANYTLSLQARKTSGAEGFLIMLNVLDNNNWTWWNVGGWGNTLDGIERDVAGTKTTYAQVSQNIASNTWYYIRIVVTGLRVQCYLGTAATGPNAPRLIQDVTLPAPSAGLAASTTYSKSTGQVIVKAVNAYSIPMSTTINVAGVSSVSSNATVIQLTSGTAADENSFAAPTYVSPVTNTISNAGTNFTLNLPANSFSIIRLTTTGINNYNNLLLQVPSPLNMGQTVASTVSTAQSGHQIDLTANTNHAITWSSANPSVATVDVFGNVTAVSPGTATITATYGALGLSASQAVAVNNTSLLAHRYSFSETSGTTVADSIGGAAWNGTLPNGGTLGGGQLSFSSAGQQYLSLPGGILSGYSAATIEMWIPSISGAATSPPFVYLFSFGNTDASGNGYDYIFFNPNLARTVISASDPGYNAEQGGNLGASVGTATSLHLTCVFDAPNQAIHVYTNGVAAGSFYRITDPLSSIGSQFAYIGRSLYTNDAYLTWTIDELRIYSGALQPADIAATDALGPNQLLSTNSPALGAMASGGGLTLGWSAAASGYTVYTSTNLMGTNWSALGVVPQMVGGQWQVNLPLTNSQEYYRIGK